jgi:hypothetical protein
MKRLKRLKRLQHLPLNFEPLHLEQPAGPERGDVIVCTRTSGARIV